MNMAGPNAGAALLGGVPLMNNGTNGEASRTGNDQDLEYETRLNTYIYDYFLKKEQYDCARSLLRSGVQIRFGQNKNSPGRRRDGDVNGTDDGAMDTDSKDDLDSKRPEDLPSADIPADQAGTSFLMEWFSTFWDMYFAQRKDKRASANAMQYVQHTQVSGISSRHNLTACTNLARSSNKHGHGRNNSSNFYGKCLKDYLEE